VFWTLDVHFVTEAYQTGNVAFPQLSLLKDCFVLHYYLFCFCLITYVG
jgi:hypothetical protein